MLAETEGTRLLSAYGEIRPVTSNHGEYGINSSARAALSLREWRFATLAIYMAFLAVNTTAFCTWGDVGSGSSGLSNAAMTFSLHVSYQSLATIYMTPMNIGTRQFLHYSRLDYGINNCGMCHIFCHNWLGALDWIIATYNYLYAV